MWEKGVRQMGCDIHPAIEFRTSANEPWKAVLSKNKNFGKEWNEDPEMVADLDLDRDYDLFAILGNVRNGSGFAGCDTGDGFDPMSDHRGIPKDISPEALASLSNEHSPTWVTLAEILAYNWDRKTRKRGVVDAVTFLDWDWMKSFRPAPDSYSGDVGGTMVVKISAEAMKEKVDAIRGNRHGRSEDVKKDVAKHLANHYCRIEWEESYSSAANQLWTKVLPVMLNLGRDHGFDNVRLVMDFDS